MPIHIAPAIRAREDAEEASGLIAVQKSDGFLVQKALEDQKLSARTPVNLTFIFNGVSTTVA